MQQFILPFLVVLKQAAVHYYDSSEKGKIRQEPFLTF